MRPIKALKGCIEDIPGVDLHILLTEEDNVIVARCLDFSVSSHGENKDDAIASLSDSIKDYLGHASKIGALNEVIDPAEDNLWEIYRNLELQEESTTLKKRADILKVGKIKTIIYA